MKTYLKYNVVLRKTYVLLFAGILILGFNQKSIAQLVYIPDPTFRTFIVNNIDPAAIIGDSLDPLNVNVLAADSINFDGTIGIVDLTGIDAFSNLVYLESGLSSSINNLPALPANLNYLGMHSLITALPALPGSLQFLLVDQNSLLQCLPLLPDGLQQLAAINTQVTCLPNIPVNGVFTSDIGTNVCFNILPGLSQPALDFCICNGEVVVIADAGVPYDYVWSNGFSDLGNSSGVSFINNACSGIQYSAIITPSVGGCISYFAGGSPGGPGEINASVNTVNVSCNGVADGSACISVNGGVGPYAYQWSTSSSASCINSLSSGSYFVIVTDAFGCSSTANFSINQPQVLNINSASVTNATCFGLANGSICLAVSGGTQPYSYDFGSGSTAANCVNNLLAGNYLVTVTDAMACTRAINVTVTEPSQLNTGLGPDQSICLGNSTLLCTNVFGGTAPYNLLWSTGNTTPCITVNSIGIYSVTVTDVNGCTAQNVASISIWPLPSVLLDSIEHVNCFSASTGGIFISTTGSSPFTYQWSTTATTQDLTNISAGNYTVTVTDLNGCFNASTFTLGCDSVWPGDANYDGIANNNDMLAIGIGFGNNGPVRPAASNFWLGQAADDWTGSLASGSNYKHIDCNGDGTINSDDTTAIVLNYGLTHPFRLMPTPAGINDPPLYFDLPVDTIGTSQQLSVPLIFGTSNIPADNIYGLAFTVNYDTALVKVDSIRIDFNNSWMGIFGNDLLFIQHNNPFQGQLNVGATRTNHSNISGFGEIARVTVVTVDNVSGRLTTTSVLDTLILSLSEVKVINNLEDLITINLLADSLIIQDTTLTVNEILSLDKIKIYPNPVNEKMFVEIVPGLYPTGIFITNIIGEKISVSYTLKNNIIEIKNLKNFSNGLYFLNIESTKGRIVKRFSLIN